MPKEKGTTKENDEVADESVGQSCKNLEGRVLIAIEKLQ